MTTQPAGWPQLGAFSYDFADLDALIATYQQTGLTVIQFAAPLLNQVLERPETIPELRRKLDDSGISVVALAGYRNITSPNPEKRRANLDFLKRCLEIAPHLGTPIVATETGTRNMENEWAASPENKSVEAWEQLQRTLDELLPVAEAHGSILALEGYVNNIVGTLDQMSAILEQFPSPSLQVVLDPFNYLSQDLLPESEQIAAEFFHRFKDRFVVAHLKDVSPQGAEIDTPEFGTGVFTHKPYIEFLRTERPDLPLILEHLPWEHVPTALEKLRHIVDDLT